MAQETHTVQVSVTPTISTGAYTAGDLVGDKLTFSDAVRKNVRSGVVESVVVIDDDDEQADFDLVLFNKDPSNTTFTDNAAFDPADADLENCIGVVKIVTHSSFNDNAVSQALGVGLGFKIQTDGDSATEDRDLFGALVTRSTPTYTATTDITVTIAILQD